MKKKSRIISLILSLSIVLTLFSGCSSSNESALLESILKTSNVTSMEAKTNLSVNFNVSGESKNEFFSTLNVFKGIKAIGITANQKVNRSPDDSIINSQLDATCNIGGISSNLSVWVDTYLEGKSPKFNEIIKLPSIATMSFPNKYKGKEYLEFDYSTLTDNTLGLSSFNPALLTKNLTKDLTTFLSYYSKQFKPGFAYVDTKENIIINGETLNAYTLKLNDKTAKDFVRYIITNFLDNKYAIEFIKNRAKLVMTKNMSGEGFDTEFAMFEEQIPEIKASINKYFDSIDKVAVFGEKGVSIDFLVNKDGYIVKEKGNLNFKINEKDFSNIFASVPPVDKSIDSSIGQVLTMDLNFDTDMFNFNQVVKVETPVLTSENSVNYNDILKEQKAEMDKINLQYETMEDQRAASEGYASVKINGTRIYFSEYPRIINGRLMAPIKPILQRLGATLEWNPKDASITCSKGDNTIILKIGSKDVYINGTKKTLDVAPQIINSNTFMPVRVITELFGGELQWDSTTKVANIIISE